MKKVKKSKKKRKRHTQHHKSKFLIIITIIILFLITYFVLNNSYALKDKVTYKNMYLASDTNQITLYNYNKESETLEEDIKIRRGHKIKINGDNIVYENKKYYKTIINDIIYYVSENQITDNKNNIVQEKNMYVRTPATILKDLDTSEILGYATKGSKLEVVGYDNIDTNGNVVTYKIKSNNEVGYIYGKYLEYKEEDSLKTYNEDYDKIYANVNNSFGGGDASKLDYYPVEKVSFENNKMPSSVYALYLNCGSNVIQNIDSYIEFAKDTKINSFVIDIKDNETPAYPAKTFQNMSITNYNKAINTYEEYKTAIEKIKQAGFYVIGRITTFKDSYYVADNPKDAILNINTNTPFMHNKSYWPSAYNRNVWYYNLSLAKEAVKEFGFNEINFDYVRFPDRMQSVEKTIEMHNTYNEDKIEAIQNFVRYITDELHKLNVYVSIDVFGETTNSTYTTAYGQYWPALSTVADVISAMPYPDHFSNGYYGINKPWNNPYKLMNMWAKFASDRQKETPSPAIARTWIQAYDVMKSVDYNGITYGAKEIEDEVNALYDAGLTGGYITWLANSNLEKYKTQKKAFQIDYLKEYNNKQ